MGFICVLTFLTLPFSFVPTTSGGDNDDGDYRDSLQHEFLAFVLHILFRSIILVIKFRSSGTFSAHVKFHKVH